MVMKRAKKLWYEWPKNPVPKRVILPLLIIFGLALFYMWEQVTYNELAIEANQLQQKRDHLFQLTQYLRAEVDYKTSFDLIEKKARTELNMRFPEEGPVILVLPDQDFSSSIRSTVESFWYTIRAMFTNER